MIKKSGILETRSHLSEIINHVMLGKEHVILRNNVPVAKIVPIKETVSQQVKNLITDINAIRKKTKKVTKREIASWKKEGRA